ncbi:MAG: hypothetical protein GY880_20600 [Planctomycetaceae bacterium]|nr:hypothetical protein [Planctomycetaceae bacterium]MCP4478936.1 hypothetical protein [Planctomycetaceae bacterium]MCP4776630.1 hypothetical protein [Planctomycetaceae bacterium]
MANSTTNINIWTCLACGILVSLLMTLDFLFFELSERKSFLLFFFWYTILLPSLLFLTALFGIGFKTIRRSLLTTAIIALLFSFSTQRPLLSSLRFAAAKPEFCELLNRFEKEEPIELPIWVGSFHVKEIKRSTSPRRPRVWFDLGQGCFNSGIVFSHNDQVFVKETARYWYVTQLSDDWFFAVDE